MVLCLWPMLPLKAMQMSIVLSPEAMDHTATRGYVNVVACIPTESMSVVVLLWGPCWVLWSCCSQGPHWCPWTILLPKARPMSVVCTPTWSHVIYCLWAMLPPETRVMSMTHIVWRPCWWLLPRNHVEVHYLCSCWLQRAKKLLLQWYQWLTIEKGHSKLQWQPLPPPCLPALK